MFTDDIKKMTLEEKQEMLFRILKITDVVPNGTKDKIEGNIIGVSLRDMVDKSNKINV